MSSGEGKAKKAFFCARAGMVGGGGFLEVVFLTWMFHCIWNSMP